MDTQKNYGDKGIKAVALITLFSIALININRTLLTKYWLFFIGAGYLYFAIHKLRKDRMEQNHTKKAWTYIIGGSFAMLLGIVLFIVQYINDDMFL